MSKNRQTKSNQAKNVIHTVLMVISPNSATVQLQNRILTKRNSKDRIGIVTVNPGTLNQSKSTRELIFNVSLKNRTALAKLIKSQGFDTVYFDLDHTNPVLIDNVIQAASGSKVKRIILSLNANDRQDDPNVNQTVSLIKKCGITYTIIRRAKLNQNDLLSYQVVKNAQPVSDSTVSPTSVADLVYQIVMYPRLHKNVDIGIAQLPYK